MHTAGIMRSLLALAALAFALSTLSCGSDGATGATGPAGAPGAAGTAGPPGADGIGEAGAPAADTGTITGTVKDANTIAIAGVAITTLPAGVTATTDATGAFTLAGLRVGIYSVVANKAGYAPFTLAGVGVAAKATTIVSLALTVDSGAPSTISGKVADSRTTPGPIVGAAVSVQGQSAKATTDANGAYTLSGVTAGPVYISVTPPDISKLLPSETRNAVMVTPATTISGVDIVLSARPSDAATYVGMGPLCSTCHGSGNTKTGDHVTPMKASAHNRSLTRIARNADGTAQPGAWTRLLNPTLTTPRTVMVPLPGSIAVA